MSKRFRFLLILAVLIIAGLFLYPSVKWYFMVSDNMKELSNSSRVEIQKYARQQAAQAYKELKDLVVSDPEASIPGKYQFIVKTAASNLRLEKKKVPSTWTVKTLMGSFRSNDEFLAAFEDHYRKQIFDMKTLRDTTMQLGLDLSGGMNIVLEADMVSLEQRLGHAPSSDEKDDAVVRAMEILNNRIDKFGVTEPIVRRQGDSQINIEIPGAADPERVRSFLMGKGSLTFQMVDEEATAALNEYLATNPDGLGSDDQPIDKNLLQAGLIVRGFYKKDSYGIDQFVRYMVVKEEIGLDGKHILSAEISRDQITNDPLVLFKLDNEGTDIFAKLTANNKDKSMAIILDDKIKAGVRIAEAIPTGNVQVQGFDIEEANDIKLILRTAALPVDLLVMNQQAVGSSLGQDAIRQGLYAISLGFMLVVLFMIVYYKGAGFIADFALLLNVVLMLAILSAFNLTLTLTGIAGIILTVGMAVDANVIIYERIKEEYLLGKSPKASVSAGFAKAFSAIADANITTFIAALFLSQLGKGPVQGFAVTLAVGIVTSMFTALFVSRFIFDVITDGFNARKLSITWRRLEK